MHVTSCVNENTLEEGQEIHKVTLDIRVGARKVVTRGAGDALDRIDAGEPESFISIDTDNYAFYLIDETDNSRIVQQISMKPVLETEDDGNAAYHIKSDIYDIDESKTYRILALANWKDDFNGTYSNIKVGLTTLEELYKDYENHNFYLRAYLMTDGKTSYYKSWVPDNEKNSGIPMFGLSKPFKMDTSKQVDIDVPLLRALTKIQVVNNTSAQLVGCRLTTFNNEGRFIPDGSLIENKDWNVEATQVLAPSIPSNVTTSEFKLKFATTDNETYTTYIPEMDFRKKDAKRPQIELDYIIEGLPTTFVIDLADYDGKKKEGSDWKFLLRNHAYIFDIQSVSMSTNLEIKTNDWIVYADQPWTYADVKPQFDEEGEFAWTEDTKIDPENPLNVEISSEKYAEGHFTLVKPEEGTWTLSIVTDNLARYDYFDIRIWNQETQNWDSKGDSVTSYIDGTEVKFSVIGTRENNTSEPFTARLILTTSTSDGRIMNVDLTPQDTSGDYFIIIQQPLL